MGGYPGLNRELTVPHTVALPIELYPPIFISKIKLLNKILWSKKELNYVGVARTLNTKYQKFMTYPFVYDIY